MNRKKEQRIIIKADDKHYYQALKRMKAESRKLQASLTKMGDIAKRAIATIIIPVGFAIRDFLSFDDAITRAGLAANATDEELAQLTETARETGKLTQRTATDSARALELLALSGFNAKQSMELLGPAVNLAVIANMDVAEAINIVTANLAKFGGGVQGAMRFIEELTYLQSQLKAEVAEIAYDLKEAGGAAKAMGVDFTEAATASGIIREQLGDSTATALKGLFNAMTKNAEIMKKYNVQVYDSTGKARGFGMILRDVENAIDGVSDAQRNEIINAITPNIRAKNALLALLAKSADEYDRLSTAAANSEGVTEKWIKTLSENFKGFWERFKSATGEAGIALINVWAESLKAALAQGALAMQWVAENAETLGYVIKKVFTFSVALLGASLLAKAMVALRVSTIALSNAFRILKIAAAGKWMLSLKLSMKGLTTAFKAGRIAASAFWAASTLGISLLITFFPEIIQFLKWLGVDFTALGRKISYVFNYAYIQVQRGWWSIVGDFETGANKIVYYFKKAMNLLQRAALNYSLFIQSIFFELFELVNRWGEKLGVDIDLTGFKMQIDEIKAHIDALNNEEIVLETGEANDKLDELDRKLYRLKNGGRGDGLSQSGPDDGTRGGAAIEEIAGGDDVGGGGDGGFYPEGTFDDAGYDAPLTDQAEQQGDPTSPENKIADAMGLEGTDEELEKIREMLEEQKKLKLDKKTEELEGLAQLEIEHAEAMRTINSDAATKQEKLDAVKYTKQYKAMESAQSSLLMLEQAGIKEAGKLAKAASLAELALKLATEPPAAFSKTFAQFGYPLGGILAPLAFAATAAQIMGAMRGVSRVGFKEGGLVTGGIPGQDSVPAMLTPGEVVVPEKNFEDLANAIKSGDGDGQTINVNLHLDGRLITREVLDNLSSDGIIR